MPKTEDPPLFLPDRPEELARKGALIIRELLKGKSNNVEDIVLDADADSTTFEVDRVSIDTAVILVPTSESAGAATGMWVETTRGSYTVHHEVSGDTDRSFKAVLVG